MVPGMQAPVGSAHLHGEQRQVARDTCDVLLLITAGNVGGWGQFRRHSLEPTGAGAVVINRRIKRKAGRGLGSEMGGVWERGCRLRGCTRSCCHIGVGCSSLSQDAPPELTPPSKPYFWGSPHKSGDAWLIYASRLCASGGWQRGSGRARRGLTPADRQRAASRSRVLCLSAHISVDPKRCPGQRFSLVLEDIGGARGGMRPRAVLVLCLGGTLHCALTLSSCIQFCGLPGLVEASAARLDPLCDFGFVRPHGRRALKGAGYSPAKREIGGCLVFWSRGPRQDWLSGRHARRMLREALCGGDVPSNRLKAHWRAVGVLVVDLVACIWDKLDQNRPANLALNRLCVGPNSMEFRPNAAGFDPIRLGIGRTWVDSGQALPNPGRQRLTLALTWQTSTNIGPNSTR